MLTINGTWYMLRSSSPPATAAARNASGRQSRKGTSKRCMSITVRYPRHGKRTMGEVDEIHQTRRHRQPDSQDEKQHPVCDAVKKNAQNLFSLARIGYVLDRVELDIVGLTIDHGYLAQVDVLD